MMPAPILKETRMRQLTIAGAFDVLIKGALVRGIKLRPCGGLEDLPADLQERYVTACEAVFDYLKEPES
jgi:hypothetical protein